MKSPSLKLLPQGPAFLAASLAVLFGAASALAQTSGSTSSSTSGSNQRDKSSSDSSTYGSSSTGSDRSQQSSQSQPSTSGSAHSASGSTLNTGAAADVDSTKEINAQTGTSATGAGAATGRESMSNKLGWSDRRFVTKTAESGKDEVALAKLATEKASNSEVKAFAQKLVDDHTKVNEELKGIASQKGVKLDADDDQDRSYKRMSKKTGMEFDQEFVEHMIDSHENSIKRFEKVAKDAKDSDVRSFASKHVDHLREHLRQAESLRATVMPTGRMDSSSGRSTSGAASSTDTSTSTSSSSDRSSSSSSSDRGSGYGSTGTGTGSGTSATSGTGTSSSGSSTDSTSSSTTPKRDGSR